MDLCDQWDVCQEKAATKYTSLNDAGLEKLSSSKTIDEFAGHWQFICNNFDLIYNDPAHVNKLCQAVLQLAVQGKLVPQDPNDEPASELLKRIKAEKEKLIAKGKIKKQKPLLPITEDEIPYELPNGWEWVRLGDVLLKITDGTHHSPPNSFKGEFKYITAKNIKNNGIDLTKLTYVSSDVHSQICARCDPEYGDILYIKDGATTGIVTINDLKEPFSMLSSVALLKLLSTIYNYFLLYVLRSPYFYSSMREDMTGVAITRVTLTKLNKALIPLVPEMEQKRIVSKVDQLMQLCDELETRLNQSKKDSEMLMQAVLHEAFS